jgi:hypothetical protein
MFGKISAIINYMKIWDVYLVKRFPSNRMSLWGNGFSYMIILSFIHTQRLIYKENSLKSLRSLSKKELTRCSI